MVPRDANSRGRGKCAAMASIMLLAVAGCVGATTNASPSASRGASSHSPTATATSAATYDLSNLPTAPAGDWKSIRWVQVPASPAAAVSATPDPSSGLVDGYGTVDVAGWSHGFVGFSVQIVKKHGQIGGPTMATVATTHSSDGVHWSDGTVITQQISVDDLDVIGLYEGPSGLLAVGESGACGSGWVEALWTSPDGVSWQKVDTKTAFGDATIEEVSGGSSGFVAIDSTDQVWTSRDGQSWRPVNLDAPVFANSEIDGGTAFSGGFVLAGSTVESGAGGCGGTPPTDPSASPTPAPPMISPALWWSADGGTWTKADLPGGISAYAVGMRVCRANDHTLVATEGYSNGDQGGSGLWTSKDGRTWKSLVWPSSLNLSEIRTDGRHGVLVTDPAILTVGGWVRDPGAGPSISMVTDDGNLVTLAQQGDQPAYAGGEQWALGPTGILWMDQDPQSNGVRIWIGLPS